MYHVQGQGIYANKPHTYYNDLGQKVVQSGGIIRQADGSPTAAYDFAPGTAGYNNYLKVLAKQKSGFPISQDDRQLLMRYNQATGQSPSMSVIGTGTSGSMSEGNKKPTARYAVTNRGHVVTW